MGTPPSGGGAERWARLHHQTKILSRETFYVGVGVVRQEVVRPQPGDRLLQKAVVVGSDYHLYQVLGDTGIGLGDVTMAIHVCFDVSSAPQLNGAFLCSFFFKIQLGRRPPDALCRLLTLWWPLTTRRLYVYRFTAGSGAGDRGAGPAAGGPRPNPELRIEKPDRQPTARGCVQCRRIEEPGWQPET